MVEKSNWGSPVIDIGGNVSIKFQVSQGFSFGSTRRGECQKNEHHAHFFLISKDVFNFSRLQLEVFAPRLQTEITKALPLSTFRTKKIFLQNRYTICWFMAFNNCIGAKVEVLLDIDHSGFRGALARKWRGDTPLNQSFRLTSFPYPTSPSSSPTFTFKCRY